MANFMIIFLVLTDIRDLLLTSLRAYSANKLVPFPNPTIIIDCLSFIEKTDRLRFKDMMIINKRL